MAFNKLELAGTGGQVQAPSSCSIVEVETVVGVAGARSESDAHPVHDDNSSEMCHNSDPIKSRQHEDASDQIGGEHEAAEMAAPLSCQEADARLEDSAAECIIEVSNAVMGVMKPHV